MTDHLSVEDLLEIAQALLPEVIVRDPGMLASAAQPELSHEHDAETSGPNGRSESSPIRDGCAALGRTTPASCYSPALDLHPVLGAPSTAQDVQMYCQPRQ